ncbi:MULTISPECIES: VanZ family protein [unclassified Nocardiopsis]|uniref:VanZ family protein n=1 Tax=Nocardiopsis TaxID=2013 RepID=UPI00387B993D
MWTVLFFATPATIGAILALLAVASLLATLVSRRSAAGFSGFARVTLTFASVAYVVLLAVIPISGVEKVGESNRSVTWNPLQFLEENRQDQQLEETYTTTLNSGEIVLYSREELSGEDRAEHLSWEQYAYFLHGAPDDLTVVRSDGGDVTSQEEIQVIGEIADRIPEEPLAYDSMMVEEKSVNALLFVPLALVAFHAFSSWPPRVFFGPALSVLIETVQWALASGRSVDAGDVLMNTVGSLTGTAMAWGSYLLVEALAARRSSAGDRRPGAGGL